MGSEILGIALNLNRIDGEKFGITWNVIRGLKFLKLLTSVGRSRVLKISTVSIAFECLLSIYVSYKLLDRSRSKGIIDVKCQRKFRTTEYP